jgi:hypothetical protein
LAVAAVGLAACGDDNGGEVRTVTAIEAEQDAPMTGDAILIETRITEFERHTAEVLSESFIGGSAFCRGGKASGGGSPAVITTFRCPRGRLRIRFAPMQRSSVQSAVWEVVSGTGSFAGLRGGGSMGGQGRKRSFRDRPGDLHRHGRQIGRFPYRYASSAALSPGRSGEPNTTRLRVAT